MKISSHSLTAAAFALLAAAVLAVSTLAQAPQAAPAQPSPAGGQPPRDYPAPTNLKVLPKTLTGQQVRDIMEKWEGSLGAHCSTCHTADPKNIGPNGRPRLNFADDSKTAKQIARVMYTMTQKINSDYISKTMEMDEDNDGSPVTCGTCHRGHKMPEKFEIPPEERGPGAGPGMPPAAQPASH